MNKTLFWRFYLLLSIVTVGLVWLISTTSLVVERKMSQIAPNDKQTLLDYAEQATEIVASGDRKRATQWVQLLREKEQVYVNIVRLGQESVVDLAEDDPQQNAVSIGRGIDWGIHLYQPNPLISLPLEGLDLVLVIELPQHMRPGKHWEQTHFILHTITPLVLMVALCIILYRYVMRPLNQLERATQEFAQGNYQVRVLPQLRGRTDELARIATTFDSMAYRIGNLIKMQRHLINDLSHELRTPLQRLNLAVSSQSEERDIRIVREADLMKQLVEDTLSLAWLDNLDHKPPLEPIDLYAVLALIAEDAQFEYPDRVLNFQLEEYELLIWANQRCLLQAFENIVRNALKHTPVNAAVHIVVERAEDEIEVSIIDEGPGVPESMLQDIFKPFFRVDKARDRDSGGFGLGLALAKRQLSLIGAQVAAYRRSVGLTMSITGLRTLGAKKQG